MTDRNAVLEASKAAIARWQQAFNNQDAAGCAAQYEEDAVMHARPFGTFTGREEIQAFWQKIIDDGFHSVEYSDVTWTPGGEDGYILSASWSMNKAFGVVHREHWLMQDDGTAKLHADDFEVLGER